QHAFVTFDGPYSVWLDVKHDRYCAIDNADTAAFRGRVWGWAKESGAPQAESAQSCNALSQLLQRGLLVELENGTLAKEAVPTSASTFVGEVRMQPFTRPAGIRAHHVCNLARASFTAGGTLKYFGLERSIARVRRRHKRELEARKSVDAAA